MLDHGEAVEDIAPALPALHHAMQCKEDEMTGRRLHGSTNTFGNGRNTRAAAAALEESQDFEAGATANGF